MSALLVRDITQEEIDTYARDGVVCLRGAIDLEWVERLRHATDKVIAKPGPFGARYGTDEDAGTFFGDLYVWYVWTFEPTFAAFVTDSPAARIAGEIMDATKVNFFYDHLLVKEPGSSAPTPWHHDLTYWCVDGDQVCSLWMPLDPVDLDNGAVEYVRGSHRWPNRYEAKDFMGRDLFADGAMEKLPDIEADRDAYDIVSYAVEPGDLLIHHALTLHGAPGNTSNRRRRALATRWCGDDVTYVERKGMSKPIRDPGLAVGDAIDCDLFPVVWRRAA